MWLPPSVTGVTGVTTPDFTRDFESRRFYMRRYRRYKMGQQYQPRLQRLQCLQGPILQAILDVGGFTEGFTGVYGAGRLNELNWLNGITEAELRFVKTLGVLPPSGSWMALVPSEGWLLRMLIFLRPDPPA